MSRLAHGYYWGKQRNAFNHWCNPAFMLRLVTTVRELREPRP